MCGWTPPNQLVSAVVQTPLDPALCITPVKEEAEDNDLVDFVSQLFNENAELQKAEKEIVSEPSSYSNYDLVHEYNNVTEEENDAFELNLLTSDDLLDLPDLDLHFNNEQDFQDDQVQSLEVARTIPSVVPTMPPSHKRSRVKYEEVNHVSSPESNYSSSSDSEQPGSPDSQSTMPYVSESPSTETSQTTLVCPNPKRKLVRFFWTDELHAKFLEVVFRLGLSLGPDHTIELAECFEASKPRRVSSPARSELALKSDLVQLEQHMELTVKTFLEQSKAARQESEMTVKINHKKGGHASFHVYPFPCVSDAPLPVVSSMPLSLGCQQTFRRLLAAIFDLGLAHARPKTVFNSMQPTPSRMVPGSIKSHLQKYRANSLKTRALFIDRMKKSLPEESTHVAY